MILSTFLHDWCKYIFPILRSLLHKTNKEKSTFDLFLKKEYILSFKYLRMQVGTMVHWMNQKVKTFWVDRKALQPMNPTSQWPHIFTLNSKEAWTPTCHFYSKEDISTFTTQKKTFHETHVMIQAKISKVQIKLI